MSSSNRPSGFTCVQNSRDRARRSASVSMSAPPRIRQDLLHQQRVDVHERGLQQVQGEQGHLLGLLVRPGQVAVLAVKEVLIRRVPVLHHLKTLVDLLPQHGVGQVVADERRPHRPPEFLDRLVGGVLRAAAGEAT